MGSERNNSLLQDPEIEKALDEATLSRDKTKAGLRELENIIFEQQPDLFLWEKPALWLISRNLRGVSFSDMGPYLHYPGPRA